MPGHAAQVTAREGLWRLTRDVEDANAGWVRQRVLTLDADAIQKALQGQEKEVVRLEKRLPSTQVIPLSPSRERGVQAVRELIQGRRSLVGKALGQLPARHLSQCRCTDWHRLS